MSLFERARKIEVVVIIAVIGVLGAVYAFTREPVKTPNTGTQVRDQQNASQNQAKVISYQGQDGRTALDLLKVFYPVETKPTSYGDMVIGINNVKADESKEFWSFYINGKMAQEGAATYVTKSSDSIEWKLEALQ